MKYMKRSKLVLILTVVILIASACASKKDNYEYSVTPTPGYKSEMKESSGYTDNEISNDTTLPAERIMILSASLSIEASDAAELYRQLVTHGNGLNGYEFSYYIYNYDDYSVIDAVIKVPPEKLNTFVNYIGENAKVISSSMNSEDITESYYDMQTRLETKRKSLERYYALLEKADTVAEIIQLQQTIDSITLEIESYEGKLKVWNSLASMATVSISIRQYNDPVKIRKEINWNTLTLDDMGYLIKSGFVSIINFIVSLLQWVLIAILVSSPLWITALCVLLIVIRWKKKHGSLRKSEKKDTEKENDIKGNVDTVNTENDNNSENDNDVR